LNLRMLAAHPCALTAQAQRPEPISRLRLPALIHSKAPWRVEGQIEGEEVPTMACSTSRVCIALPAEVCTRSIPLLAD
jgi:hypothetical protein